MSLKFRSEAEISEDRPPAPSQKQIISLVAYHAQGNAGASPLFYSFLCAELGIQEERKDTRYALVCSYAARELVRVGAGHPVSVVEGQRTQPLGSSRCGRLYFGESRADNILRRKST